MYKATYLFTIYSLIYNLKYAYKALLHHKPSKPPLLNLLVIQFE